MAASTRVRIADIAVRAGAGVEAVWRAFNRVSDSTGQRVLEAIEATSYRPDGYVRGEALRPLREALPLELDVAGSTTAARGHRTADRAGPAQPEPAGSRSRLSLARVL